MGKILCVLLLMVGSLCAGELENIDKQSKIWQHKFGMDKWTISVEVVGENSIREYLEDSEGFYMGASFFNRYTRTGIIKVLKSSEYPKDKRYKTLKNIHKDQKNTVIHEFCHAAMNIPSEEWAATKFTALILHEKPPKKKN
jgi:hypothetical protein